MRRRPDVETAGYWHVPAPDGWILGIRRSRAVLPRRRSQLRSSVRKWPLRSSSVATMRGHEPTRPAHRGHIVPLSLMISGIPPTLWRRQDGHKRAPQGQVGHAFHVTWQVTRSLPPSRRRHRRRYTRAAVDVVGRIVAWNALSISGLVRPSPTIYTCKSGRRRRSEAAARPVHARPFFTSMRPM